MNTRKTVTQTQLGFTPITLLIILAVFVLLGVVGWRVWEARQTTNNSNPQIQQDSTNSKNIQNSAPGPNECYIVIKEWNVRFKPVEGLEGVEYFRPGDFSEADSVSFTTRQLGDMEPQCGISSSSPVIGLLTRNKEKKSGDGGVVAVIGEYNYQYHASQAICSKNSENFVKESKITNQISASLKTLELAQ